MPEEQQENSKKKIQNPAGKLLSLIQLAVSMIFAVQVCITGILPVGYFNVLTVVLLAFFALAHGSQYFKNKALNILGIIFSLMLSAALIFMSVYLQRAINTLAEISGVTYKTDNMIVAVLKDDPAETILDASDYRFGDQTSLDQENTKLMLEDLRGVLGEDMELVEYDTLDDLCQALLDGQIDAAVYNEGYTGIIDDSIAGYSDQIRILYQYGIETSLDTGKNGGISDDTEAIEEYDTDDYGTYRVDEPFTVYISGIDVSGQITTNSRSDVNIIMTVNPQTKEILLTTTPRDYYVTLPGVSGESRDKLTHAGIYGVDVSMATLEELYDTDIDYYVRANFTSLVMIVDALGGVDVYSEYDFTTYHGGYHITEGMNHMDGATALGFARERYAFVDGDNQRGKNQEVLLTAILQKAMSPAILTGMNQILNNVSDCIQTNMTYEEMARLINRQLSDPGDWTIESVAAVGTSDRQRCYSTGRRSVYVIWPDEESVAEISDRMKEVLSGS